MRINSKLALVVGLSVPEISVFVSGCATKRYVATVIAPIDARVSGTEAKNVEQDKQLAANAKELEELDRGLSRTKEQLKDTDSKATAAGEAAARAGERADNAHRAADGARSLAEQGIQRTSLLEKTVDAMNRYQMLKSET